ncbi:MAG TPA: ATP-binding protein [Thermoanaerobaculia bacterium]|jgi:predicted ATPase|nr:ATP-binding protein [Thermoanaerobaculia bacterium]
MRIAISGAHRTGKTTLIEELSRALPTYVVVDEPYHLLEEEGYEFEALPSVEDFELQLERSIECLADRGRDQLFDRCPADLLAYLISHPDSDRYDVKPWLPRVRDAMQGLDLIVFVPIETPDVIRVFDPEDADLRQRVDEELRDIVLGDRWDLGVEAIEVTGSVRERARQVLAQVQA